MCSWVRIWENLAAFGGMLYLSPYPTLSHHFLLLSKGENKVKNYVLKCILMVPRAKTRNVAGGERLHLVKK